MSDPKHTPVANAPHVEIQRMHPVVGVALQHVTDPAALRELLAIQQAWEAAEAKRAYDRAKIQLKRDLPAVIVRDKTVSWKPKTGQAVYYQHASLAAVMDAVTESLCAHDFTLDWRTRCVGSNVEVTAILAHAEGHSESTTLAAAIDTSGSKSNAQGVASTATLLSRHTALLLLGIATRDHADPTPGDDDAPGDDEAPAEGGRRPPSRARWIDTSANLRAAAAVAKRGGNGETILGVPVAEWTAAHLDTLRAWCAANPAERKGDPAAGGGQP